MWRALALVLVATMGILLVAACDDDEDSEVSGATLSSAVVLGVSGGITGMVESVTVAPDGRVSVSRGGTSSESTLSDQDLERLAEALEVSGAFVADRDLLSGKGADLVTYRITYSGATVTMDDTTVPPDVEPALDQLLALRAR
jgi:hypothetical protein